MPSVTERERTDIYDEMFSDECATYWIVKSDKVPTRNAAKMLVHTTIGEGFYIDLRCRTRHARIDWRDGEGWWLTCDDGGRTRFGRSTPHDQTLVDQPGLLVQALRHAGRPPPLAVAAPAAVHVLLEVTMSDPRTLGQKIADAAHENMPSLRKPGPKVPTGPAEGTKPQPHEAELMGLSVVVTVFERMTDAERRRALNYLNDRYGGTL